jgi:hypothetical protein
VERAEKMAGGLMWRIIGTILAFSAFLIGSLIYVGFYTSGFDLGQKVIVVLVALIIAFAAVAIMWVTFAGRRGWMAGRWGPQARHFFLKKIRDA